MLKVSNFFFYKYKYIYYSILSTSYCITKMIISIYEEFIILLVDNSNFILPVRIQMYITSSYPYGDNNIICGVNMITMCGRFILLYSRTHRSSLLVGTYSKCGIEINQIEHIFIYCVSISNKHLNKVLYAL